MDRYVGVRDEGGHLRCVIGAAVARVTVEGHGSLEVVGVGGPAGPEGLPGHCGLGARADDADCGR